MNARLSHLFALTLALPLVSCRFVGMKPDFSVMGDSFKPAEADSVYIESKPQAATPLPSYQPPPAPSALPRNSSPVRRFFSQLQNAPAMQDPAAPAPKASQVQPPLPQPPRSAAVASTTPQVYTVAPGDSLARIARIHKVPLGTLATANGIDLQNPLIKPGQQLRIPQGAATIAPAPRSATPAVLPPAPTPAAPVAPATPTLQLNPVAPVATPAPAPAPAATPAGTYRICPGDTLYAIARKFKTTPEQLMRANNLTPETAHSLRIGTILTIPTQP